MVQGSYLPDCVPTDGGRTGRARLRSIVSGFVAVALGVATAFGGSSANANGACFSEREILADQMLQLHSELMVVGLTCDSSRDRTPAYELYRNFTVEHNRMLAGHEDVLIEHFRRHYDGSAASRLHTYRTELANDVSQRVLVMDRIPFCRAHKPALIQTANMSEEELYDFISAKPYYQLYSAPPCDPVSEAGVDSVARFAEAR